MSKYDKIDQLIDAYTNVVMKRSDDDVKYAAATGALMSQLRWALNGHIDMVMDIMQDEVNKHAVRTDNI